MYSVFNADMHPISLHFTSRVGVLSMNWPNRTNAYRFFSIGMRQGDRWRYSASLFVSSMRLTLPGLTRYLVPGEILFIPNAAKPASLLVCAVAYSNNNFLLTSGYAIEKILVFMMIPIETAIEMQQIKSRVAGHAVWATRQGAECWL